LWFDEVPSSGFHVAIADLFCVLSARSRNRQSVEPAILAQAFVKLNCPATGPNQWGKA
jgi:hypothetical protein